MIEVICACDRKYLPHTATMLCSLLENNPISRIHLLYDGIPQSSLFKLRRFVSKYGAVLDCHKVCKSAIEDLSVDKWASVANYYRLLAERILAPTIDKVLYLIPT